MSEWKKGDLLEKKAYRLALENLLSTETADLISFFKAKKLHPKKAATVCMVLAAYVARNDPDFQRQLEKLFKILVTKKDTNPW